MLRFLSVSVKNYTEDSSTEPWRPAETATAGTNVNSRKFTTHLLKEIAYWTIDHVGNWTIQKYQHYSAVLPHLDTVKLQVAETSTTFGQYFHLTTFSFPE